MATGIHGYMECEPAEPEPDTSCHAGAQHMRHLSSKSYLETTCCGACPDRAAAVSAAANPPGPIEAVPRSTHNEVGASQLKTSRMRRVPVGRSTRGRTPLALLRPSHGPTSGRRLTSCCMQAGDLELRPILPQLPERPPGARYLLSRSDAGTLIVTLPPRGIKAAISLDASTIDVWAYVPILYAICGLFMVWPSVSADFSGISLAPAVLVQQLLDIVDPYAPFVSEVAVNAIFGCAGASWLTAWLAARAFTTATLSVGEFQWEYKETIAGMIPTCYRTPCGQCSYSCRAGASPLTRMQLPWVCMAPVNVGGRCKSRTRLSPLPRVARVARVVANERIMRLETFKVDAQCDSAAIFRRPSPSGGSQHCASSQA